MPINTGAGASSEYFGHADYEASIAAGYTPTQIYDYLQSNQNQLRGSNVAGGGGIFDIARAQADAYQQQQARQQIEQKVTQQITSLKTGFESAIQEQQRQIQAQQEAYQKRVEQMQQQMLQAQTRQAAAPQTAQVAAPGKSMIIRSGASTRFSRPELQIKSMNI
jgi:hypothetical protein